MRCDLIISIVARNELAGQIMSDAIIKSDATCLLTFSRSELNYVFALSLVKMDTGMHIAGIKMPVCT